MTPLAGILLPADVLHSGWFQALATFVAINALVYATLSLTKAHPTATRVSASARR